MAKYSTTKGIRSNQVLKASWKQPRKTRQDCDKTWPRHLSSVICKWRHLILSLRFSFLPPPFSKLPAAAELRCCSSQLPSQGNGHNSSLSPRQQCKAVQQLPHKSLSQSSKADSSGVEFPTKMLGVLACK